MGNTKSKKKTKKQFDQFQQFIDFQEHMTCQKQPRKFNREQIEFSIFDERNKIQQILNSSEQTKNVYLSIGDRIFQVEKIEHNSKDHNKLVQLKFIRKQKRQISQNQNFDCFQKIQPVKKPFFVDQDSLQNPQQKNQNVFYTSNFNINSQSKTQTLNQTPKFESVNYLELHQLVSKDQIFRQKQSTIYNANDQLNNSSNNRQEVKNFQISSDAKYTGGLLNGFPDGHGTLIYDNGTIYKGDFENGKKHGFGRLHIPERYTYKGQFLNDQFEGTGEKINENGTIYSGEFLKGLEDGQGCLKNKQGQIIQTGFWKDGMYLNNNQLFI